MNETSMFFIQPLRGEIGNQSISALGKSSLEMKNIHSHMGMFKDGGVLGYKDLTPMVLWQKSRRDLIFVTRSQNIRQNPIGIQYFYFF
jgi:hypothetical protein